MMSSIKIFNRNALGCNTYIYILNAYALIVDSSGQTDEILEYLRAHQPQNILLAYTHGHFDHVVYGFDLQKGLSDLKISYKTVAPAEDKIYFSPEGQQILEDCLTMFDVADAYPDARIPHIDSFFSDGDNLGFADFRVLHTPGHTQGSYCFYSPEQKILFSGDTIFAGGGTGRTDLPGGSGQELLQSLQKLACLPPDITIYPGHGPKDILQRSLKALPGA